MTDITQDIPIAAQAPPPRPTGVTGWLRVNLFSSAFNSVLTLLCVGLLVAVIPPVIRWGLIDAIWSAPNGAACHDGGACWAFIAEKFRFILFGRYPLDQVWRPVAVIVI